MSYSVQRVQDYLSYEYIEKFFPDYEADELNFVLFSTSGISGSYSTLEDAEEVLEKLGNKVSKMSVDDPEFPTVTFIICQPRKVEFHYGNTIVHSKSHLKKLKKLRKTSHEAVSKIGIHYSED